MLRIGVISDTHGLLRTEAIAFLRGCSRIVHAGDIGLAAILDDLATLADPAVRGNNDVGDWAEKLPEVVTVAVDGFRIHVVHDLSLLALDPSTEGIDVVVSGHSHKPATSRHRGVLYVNPGSAGPRRFKLPVSIGELIVENGVLDGRIQSSASRRREARQVVHRMRRAAAVALSREHLDCRKTGKHQPNERGTRDPTCRQRFATDTRRAARDRDHDVDGRVGPVDIQRVAAVSAGARFLALRPSVAPDVGLTGAQGVTTRSRCCTRCWSSEF
jgi:putative phosphoesterase